jgi:hypothetical protein
MDLAVISLPESSCEVRSMGVRLGPVEGLMAMPITEHMEVVGSDGAHVGTVEDIKDTKLIRLTKDDPEAGGEHHYIPLAWVVHAEIKVHLRLSAVEAKTQWLSH